MRMALRNIWSRKVSSSKVLMSITIMITILCVFVTYAIALEEKTTEIVLSYRSGHYYSTETDERLSESKQEDIRSIANVKEIKDYSVYTPKYDIYGIDFRHEDEDLRCYHTDYRQGKVPPNASELEIVFHRGKIAFIDSKSDLFAVSDKLESDYRWGKTEFIQSGVADATQDEILVSTEFLREYHLTNAIVGQSIEMRVEGQEYHSYKIVGILSKKFFQLTGNVEMPQLIFSRDSYLYQQLPHDLRMTHVTEVHVTDYMSAKRVAQDLVIVAGIINFKTGSSYGLAMASTVTLVNIVLVGVMTTVGLGIVIALLLNIMFSTQFMITKKANYYGMIRAYGATKRRVFWLMFLEIFIIAVVSILLGYGLSYALAFLLKLMMYNLIGLSIVFTPLNFGLTFVSAIVFSVVLLFVVTLINYTTAIRSNIVHLLRRSIES